MYISEITIEGCINCLEKLKVSLNKGLNVLVEENASGKSTIIETLCMLLRNPEQPILQKMISIYSFQ